MVGEYQVISRIATCHYGSKAAVGARDSDAHPYSEALRIYPSADPRDLDVTSRNLITAANAGSCTSSIAACYTINFTKLHCGIEVTASRFVTTTWPSLITALVHISPILETSSEITPVRILQSY